MRTRLDRNETLALVTAIAGFSLTPPALAQPGWAALPRTATGKSNLNGIEQPILA
jgi:hypothetical protein